MDNMGKYQLEITRIFDEMTDKLSLYSPPYKNLMVWKMVKDGMAFYFIQLKVFHSNKPISDEVIVLFEDGTKWIRKDDEMHTESQGSYYDIIAFITLEEEDLNLFSTKRIKRFRVGGIDGEFDGMNENTPEYFMNYVVCIQDMN